MLESSDWLCAGIENACVLMLKSRVCWILVKDYVLELKVHVCVHAKLMWLYTESMIRCWDCIVYSESVIRYRNWVVCNELTFAAESVSAVVNQRSLLKVCVL